MKYHLLALFIITAFLTACSGKEKVVEQGNIKETLPLPVDSFTVSGIGIGQQVTAFQYINDSMLSSYNLIYKELGYFKKGAGKDYHVAANKPMDVASWSSHFIGNDGLNYFISRENLLTAYDASGHQKLSERQIGHAFKYLKDSFMVLSSHETPALQLHDTLITFIAHSDPKNYYRSLKEPSIAEFRLKKDSIEFIRSYLEKPAGLDKYCFPMGKYCLHNNKVMLIHPCFDTLYIFDRSNNTSSKICIHNKDYALPRHYDMSKVMTPEYGSYQTKYALDNFQYSSIYYNGLTHHYILFYFPPLKDTFKDRLATPVDQKMKAVILNDSLEVIGYDVFDIKGFVTPESYFYMPGKGLAIPTVKSTEDFETARFYIYNL